MRRMVYESTDALSKLVTVIIRRFSKSVKANVVWIYKFFAFVTDVVRRDHQEKQLAFKALPYHRLMIMFFMDICEPNPDLTELNLPVSSKSS